jgi:hypothetical protein
VPQDDQQVQFVDAVDAGSPSTGKGTYRRRVLAVTPSDLTPRQRESLANLRIGAWATMCCYIDLYQITTGEDVAEIREDFMEPDYRERCGYTVWPTLRDALLDMRPDFATGHPIDAPILAEIDRRLSEEP